MTRDANTSSDGAGWGRHLRTRILVLAAVLTPLTAGANYLLLQRPMDSVLARDERNLGVAVQVRYRFYVDFTTIVYNVVDVAPQKSCIDVFRPFLQFAYRVKSRPVRKVILARDGAPRFVVAGSDFNEFGRTYATRSPIASIPVMLREVRRLDGSPAFGSLPQAEASDEALARQFQQFCAQWVGAPFTAGR
jgi:hypothetical protein